MTGMEPDEYDAYMGDLEQRLAEQEGYRTSEEYFKNVVEYERRAKERSIGGGQETSALGVQGQDGRPADAEANAEGGAGETVAEPKPVGTGDFGPIYDQFKGKPKEAIDFLLKEQSGEAIGALSHKDVGDIDLAWGDEGTGKSDGYGLAKLAKFHPEVLSNLQGILDDMHVTKHSDNRIQLESDSHQATIRLTWNEQKKNWLLTAFEKKNSALDNTTDTGETSTGGCQNDTATLQSTVSEGKGTKNISEKQENEENSKENFAAKLAEEKGKTPPPSKTPGQSDVEAGAVTSNLSLSEAKGTENISEKQENKEKSEENFAARLAGAKEEVDTAPTDEQKKAGYYRKDKWKNDEDVIADLREPGQSDAAADVSKPQTPNDNGGEPINAKTQTSSSEGKGTENISEKQENEEKSEENFAARLAEAKEEVDTAPTDEQKKAGNYKMGHISFGGYKMSIENPKGSTRSGVDKSGKPWSIEMKDTYGYIGQKYGADGDHLDFFINDDADLDNWNGRVFVIDQKNGCLYHCKGTYFSANFSVILDYNLAIVKRLDDG